jgi:uncharacterized protein (DUF1778 family)
VDSRKQMDTQARTTDAKGRICLPKAFADAIIIIEQVSETELRLRKALVVPEDGIRFREETPLVLSDRDRDRFLLAIEKPPKPNAALRRAATKHIKKHG